jgi:hypothetical protein
MLYGITTPLPSRINNEYLEAAKLYKSWKISNKKKIKDYLEKASSLFSLKGKHKGLLED